MKKARVKSDIKRYKEPSESPVKILMKFQDYALASVRNAPPTHKIILLFTNDGNGTPWAAQLLIQDWCDRQPWINRIKGVYLE